MLDHQLPIILTLATLATLATLTAFPTITLQGKTLVAFHLIDHMDRTQDKKQPAVFLTQNITLMFQQAQACQDQKVRFFIFFYMYPGASTYHPITPSLHHTISLSRIFAWVRTVAA